jgi:hypothetical protein
VSSDIFELNCPFCDKLYKLPREKVMKHVGKSIHCRKCGQPFSIPALPPDEPIEIAPPFEEVFPEEPPAPTEPAIEAEPEPVAVMATAPVVLEPSEESPAAEEIAAEHAAPEEHEPQHSSSQPLGREPIVSEQLEEHPVEVPFATGDSFEPPPLSEYAEEPIAEFAGEAPADGAFGADEESFDGPITEIASETPEAAKYFASESLLEPAIPLTDDEPPADAISHEERAPESSAAGVVDSIEPAEPVPSDPHDSMRAFAMVDELPDSLDIESHVVETPPPQVATAPSAPPPLRKPKKSVRALVAPVFDAESEEPQPRRRGMFGSRTEPEAPVEILAAVAAAPAEEVQAVDVEVDKETDEPESSFASRLTGQPELETAESEPPPAKRERPPVVASPATGPMQASPEVLELWSAIRRSVALLATMSMIIAIVLIAILLTLLGIIPKK